VSIFCCLHVIAVSITASLHSKAVTMNSLNRDFFLKLFGDMEPLICRSFLGFVVKVTRCSSYKFHPPRLLHLESSACVAAMLLGIQAILQNCSNIQIRSSVIAASRIRTPFTKKVTRSCAVVFLTRPLEPIHVQNLLSKALPMRIP